MLLPHFLFLIGHDFLIIIVYGLLVETVDQDGEEEVEQDEVADEDPRDVVDGGDSFEEHGVVRSTHRSEQNLLPILHCQHLEHRDEGDGEGFIVGSGQLLILPEIVVTLEDLSAQEGVDEDKHEHENCDQNEIHKRALDDFNNHDH